MSDWFRIAVAAMALCLASDPVRSDDVYQVGIAVVDITPEYPIRLNGFGNRREESAGVSQPIFAKALAVSQHGQSPLVLVTLDSLGIRAPMVDEVARRLRESHQLPRQNLAVTFSHSHCTPKVNGACDNIFSQAIPEDHQKHIDRYTSELTDRITEVARQAIDDSKPGRLEWAIGKVEFAKNRRTVGGPVDHDLPMLVVRDAKSNRPRAIYVSYACHCVTLSFNKVSGDWAGYAAAMIERMVPGAVAMVSIGAGSDQNPISGVTGDQVQVAEAQGIEIATEVKRLLAEEGKPIMGSPTSVLNQIVLPLNEIPTREQLLGQTSKGRPTDKHNATTQLARLDRGEERLTQIDYPIQTWSFGDSFCMAFLAGEVCVDYSLRLKKELDYERFWLNTYSNDFCCYIPSERLVREGGYGGGAEVPYFALPTTLKAGLEQLIVDEVHRQVPRTFHVPKGTQGVAPKRPLDSLQCMKTHDELEVQLVAAEPNVVDPVAIDFGTDGRLWVAEMNDYGRGVYEGFQQSSRVRWLRDTDQDGYFDEAQTFVEGLRFPTDVKVWRDGVLICDAPDILFAQDTNGDGTADSVKKLFSGFEVRNAQARVNSLRFGLDNWLYGACGLFGGTISSHQTGETVDCSNRDFRINPDTGAIEPVSGRTQQGRCRNDWGDWFGCSNGTLLQSIPSDERYAKRNPLSPPSRPPAITIDAEAYKLYAPDNLVTFELSGPPGRATAACGLGIYRDVALGHEYSDDAFTCEPVHQSVHRIDFVAGGHGFSGRRGAGEESSEFLSSTDRWFRPVQARTGPDGALWIVDMYRYVIEHSRWIPQSALAELDIYAGQKRGRIYRIASKSKAESGSQPGEQGLLPDLTALSNDDLVAKLDSSNGPIRDLAHQMLLWRGATDVVPTVANLAERAKTAAGAIQALALLDGLKHLKATHVQAALESKHPQVIRFAIRLGEPFLNTSPELKDAIFALAAHDNVRVRRQVALSIGAVSDPSATQTLVRLLSRTESDPHVRTAALNSVSQSNINPVLDAFLGLPESERGAGAQRSLLQLAIKVADSDTVNRVLTALCPLTIEPPPESSVDLLIQALNGLDSRAKNQTIECELNVRRRLQRLHRWAMDELASEAGDNAHRIVALKLLGRRFGPFTRSVLIGRDDGEKLLTDKRIEVMARLVAPRFSLALQQQAITAIAATGSPEVVDTLLEAYVSLSSEPRIAVIDVLLTQKNGPQALLSAVAKGTVQPEELDASRRGKLMLSIEQGEREGAERLFGLERKSPRSDIVQELKGVIQLTGDANQGRFVFRKHCSSCHRLEDHGHVVGPDLRALTNRDPEWLLTTMLDPNRQVDARYISWLAITRDGQTASGMIVQETATAIRMREAGGQEHVIDRTEIEAIRSSQRSVMPEGLEKDMSAQDLSDVIAYLSNMESPSKTLPGNQPQILRPDGNGFLSLTAAVAQIRGADITFERPFYNIGYWHDQKDTATWKVEIPETAEFDIYIDAACANASAGNKFRIDGLPVPIDSTVSGTNGWDKYRQQKVGTSTLKAGSHVITVRAAGPVQQALFDLREVRLVPSGTPPMFVAGDVTDAPLPRYPPEIAPFLLDESQSTERRQKVIDQRPGMGPGIISLLVAGIESGDLQEEYRRIPWIWRVAIAVAKRNDGGEIRDLLEISVPSDGGPLRDWQAVVIGGGLINGTSQLGLWPKQRLAEILTGLPTVSKAWPPALQLAAAMADDESIRSGTRYDALRMVALLNEQTAVEHLLRYLRKGTPNELQMGAVSGLADIDSNRVVEPLFGSLEYLEGTNRMLAIEGLLRTDESADLLAQRIKSGRLALTPAEMERLTRHKVDAVRRRAQDVCGRPDDSE